MISALLFLSLATCSYSRLFTESLESQQYIWNSFKSDFNKNYASLEEDVQRFNIFIENLKLIDQRNQDELLAGGSGVHGITKFSDLSAKEFASRYLLSDVSKKSNDAEKSVEIKTNVTATLVDWTGIYTTPVKDQGYCGSCWAFSATEQIESDAIRTLQSSNILSPEQIVQCDKTSAGCNGGWTESAYKYVSNAGGLSTEAAYPYTSSKGITGTCHADKSDYVIGVKSYHTVSGESNMAAYVQSTGPLSVCVDASGWSSYTGGIMTVCGKNVDHCVQAVGVLAESGGYWKVRNSWGTSWGESGYIRLAYGKNTCDITNDPTYVTVSLV